MNAAQADAYALVATTGQRVLDYFSMWANAEMGDRADFASVLSDYKDAIVLAARAEALAEFVAEMHDRLDKAVTL